MAQIDGEVSAAHPLARLQLGAPVAAPARPVVVGAILAPRGASEGRPTPSRNTRGVRCRECGKPYFTGRMLTAVTCAVCKLRAAGGLAGIGPKRRPGTRA
jgi:hypothetical protein